MAGVLIEMRAAILRRSTTASRGRMIGGLALVLFVTLLAVGTLLAGLTRYQPCWAPRSPTSPWCSA